MTATALMTALTAVLGPLSIPIGPVPVSLTILPLLLSVLLLDWKWAGISCILYLLLGLVGLPVFSGFQGGVSKLAGPTGGYLIGFVPMVIVSGLIMKASGGKTVRTVFGLLLGVVIAYLFGTAWFMVSTENDLYAALMLCVVPFIPVDLLKIVIAALIGFPLRNALLKAGLIGGKKSKS